ncbi:hypothetical protein ACFO8M_00895 [Glycomyces rhizosphaerae]|uniref:Uncharacterized protein n=1 Tax=Glycomyces rhizosphaerae TaxID=2054422 RepID=A0ABV7PV46_9ACTN
MPKVLNAVTWFGGGPGEAYADARQPRRRTPRDGLGVLRPRCAPRVGPELDTGETGAELSRALDNEPDSEPGFLERGGRVFHARLSGCLVAGGSGNHTGVRISSGVVGVAVVLCGAAAGCRPLGDRSYQGGVSGL